MKVAVQQSVQSCVQYYTVHLVQQGKVPNSLCILYVFIVQLNMIQSQEKPHECSSAFFAFTSNISSSSNATRALEHTGIDLEDL